ncbi:hypothetical protein TPHA_0J02830 [Tetrapisispora phaffii CBS 4417]|uniref:Mitochondrial distribution and morphology protein 32 n=1 Tax=Tetrapisispora phaffii (strain ATCC 24235 / CBS 4417 / NBRC 1672 / NRRL Y-8282 / UCD 70-5) TaxID=1071381 RepID=G8BZ12_TETPH|nr:hypothetical protein TPHA_0J02830 [Tetrapisispora phaffii CBS 4417]CCE65104.1 hypothetical protein TPHA_0J02830 [Tetrapisispora phaffii CBS 4417]
MLRVHVAKSLLPRMVTLARGFGPGLPTKLVRDSSRFARYSHRRTLYNSSLYRTLPWRNYSTKSVKELKDVDDEMSKNTDFLHIQNILLQKNKERMDKQKLLAEATNFYERFKINTKWFLIRGNRPFSADEIGTLFSWLILSQIIWVILGTTTFVSIILLIFNTVFAKEMVGRFIGRMLNMFLDGIDVQFQDALVPEWQKGCIRFHNVNLKTVNSKSHTAEENSLIEINLNMHQIDMTLSLRKWLLGNGLINDIAILGMTGEVSTCVPNKDSQQSLIQWFQNPKYKLGEVKVADSSIVLHDHQLQKNFTISVYNMELQQFRFEWMIRDFLNANVVDGSINNSLFNFHKRQLKLTHSNELEHDLSGWERITRLRVDSMNVRQLGLHRTDSFGWIEDGELDIVADIMVPTEDDNSNKNELLSASLKNLSINNITFYDTYDNLHDNIDNEYAFNHNITRTNDTNKYLVLDLKFKFKNLKASFPTRSPRLSTGEQIISVDELKPIISYINTKYALFHSHLNSNEGNTVWNSPNIFINKAKSYPVTTVFQSSKRTDEDDKEGKIGGKKQVIRFHDDMPTPDNEIVLNFRVVKNVEELRNMVLFGETGIYDSLTMELYVDLMKIVEEWEFKKKNDWVKAWGSTFASQLIIVGIGAMV